MVVAQGDIFWADLPAPRGSEPGFRRPVVVIQNDSFNQSKLNTAVCVILTSELRRAGYPGNVVLEKNSTGLNRDSVANVTQVVTVDKAQLLERVGHVSSREIDLVLDGVASLLRR